jgi:putative flippase GtrA
MKTTLFGQLFRFGVIGISGVLLDAVLYYLLLKTLPIAFAKGISVTISVVYGYFMHSRWTFQNKKTLGNLFLYCIVYGISILQNIFTNFFVGRMIKNSPYNLIIAFLTATFISICINFAGMKFIVFRRGRGL